MIAYSWPGNVRELENILHRAVLMSESAKISAKDIQIRERMVNNSDNSVSQIGDEKQMLFNTLGYCLGDMSKASSILGVSIQILKEKLEKYTK